MTAKPIALFTRGAQGIGFACAEAIAEEGARIFLADMNEDGVKAAAAKLGKDTAIDACDIGQLDQVVLLFGKIQSDIGNVSVLVNNAGTALPADFLEVSNAYFQRVLNADLTSSFLFMQRALKSMITAGIKGTIVNISIVNAQIAIPPIAAYCASKGGIMQLTKAATLALALHSIRINADGPGSIDTDMMAAVIANPGAMTMVMSRNPLKRIGSQRGIGDVAAFLASSKAN